ncbi:MmcQ/YjbR family DNA-binding protein [Nocardia sp. NPDC057440]|uniref:MmcQ/YjbR family DNA-binding protein n=1 Tax=Nocardia sp. NPDC057440 TaxID=3346134 RepID=UPI00366E0C30
MKVVGTQWHDRRMVTVEDVRGLALTLPRSYEAVVADRIKFRVGRIVYLAFSRDESVMGFAFPKQERAALIAAEPEKFRMPRVSDQRYNWLDCWTAAIDDQEMRELVIDAWRMVVPKFLHDHPSTSTSDS